MSARIVTTAVRRTCACGRLLAIQIAGRILIKQRGARSLHGGGARVTCDACKRLSTFTHAEITRP